jgi:hypothetical protein
VTATETLVPDRRLQDVSRDPEKHVAAAGHAERRAAPTYVDQDRVRGAILSVTFRPADVSMW